MEFVGQLRVCNPSRSTSFDGNVERVFGFERNRPGAKTAILVSGCLVREYLSIRQKLVTNGISVALVSFRESVF